MTLTFIDVLTLNAYIVLSKSAVPDGKNEAVPNIPPSATRVLSTLHDDSQLMGPPKPSDKETSEGNYEPPLRLDDFFWNNDITDAHKDITEDAHKRKASDADHSSHPRRRKSPKLTVVSLNCGASDVAIRIEVTQDGSEA